jgi:virginiamycin B lyase
MRITGRVFAAAAALIVLSVFDASACRPFGSYAFLEDKDGGIWFTEGDNNAISRLAPDGTVKSFPIPTENAEPADLAFDKNGNIWFVEMSGNKVGKLSKNGKITEYPMPTHHAHSVKIVVDSYGDAWFTETPKGGSKIGRLTGDSRVVEYPVQTGIPTAIAVDGDNNIWVSILVPAKDQTDNAGSRGIISVLSRDGKWKEVLRREGSCPMNIMIDSSGNTWFSDRCSSSIEKMDKKGRLTSFGMDKNAFIQKMIMDKDGNLWFADRMRNLIGRITASGKIEEFPLPGDNGGPFSLIMARNGDLYFSEILNYNLNKRTKEGSFEEHLVMVDYRKEAKITEGDSCRLEFASKIARKSELEKKRMEEIKTGRLKESEGGSSKVVEERCGTLCHDSKRILLSRKTDWTYTVNRMQENRAAVNMPLLTDEEKKIIITYLNQYYSIGKGPISNRMEGHKH